MTAAHETLEAQYRALRTGRGAHRLPRDVLSVSGADAAGYLQGQCSQDLAALDVGRAADSLLLAPEGKVVGLVRVLRTGEESFALDVEAGFGETVGARLTRFLLRAKVRIEPLEWDCVALRGEIGADDAGDGAYCVPVTWSGWSGVDLLGPAGALRVAEGTQWCGVEAWEACRIESGIPVLGRELDQGTIPAESGLVDRTVSFTKGCYTGQELVARIDSRGNRVARRLCGLVLPAGVDPAGLVGGELIFPGAARTVGRVTSAAICPGLGAVGALAYVHRSIKVGETVTVGSRTGPGAQVRALPLV